ncbi:phage baseplate assembly protein V [Ramlibacter alkalitolerans]|uniref:Type IV secretion protein Rhs n=1 Tax=Ramlibacter alkalitolerans TaxID=2039631 RepID=A0ABS1JIH1_9BURK|nr:phage baseplate assembly protein V [Ramlibacter alkalitolerans]MBL0423997.1 type IV secretion protein Rhs [Ramlibacter alkalitolerans]
MQRDLVFPAPPAWAASGLLARVVSLNDPEGMNRVQVRLLAFDAVAQQDAPMWARVVAPFAGKDRGVFFLPDVDDEVLVVFVQGDPRHPLVLGGVWNGSATPPASLSGGQNQTKCIKSKNGIVVTLEDRSGQEKLQLETPGGCKLTLQDGPGAVTIEDSNGNSIKLETAGITIQAAAKVTVQASSVAVSAGMVTVDAAISKFSGMVKCDVLQTNAVISSSYTPGAGNVW